MFAVMGQNKKLQKIEKPGEEIDTINKLNAPVNLIIPNYLI